MTVLTSLIWREGQIARGGGQIAERGGQIYPSIPDAGAPEGLLHTNFGMSVLLSTPLEMS